MALPAEIIPVLAQLAPVFTAPTYQKALVLVVGTILAKGRRTVTSALRAVGHTQTADWSKYHHVLNQARWSGLQVSRLLLEVLVATWRPTGQVTIAVDKTLERRLVEVYNQRLHRWEGPEHLNELAASVPWLLHLQVAFHHAHTTRRVTVSLGRLPLRLPTTQQQLWALVAYDPDYQRQIILLTNVPLTSPELAEQVYTQWRCCPHIEHTYRFDQEQGPEVEDMRVQTVERMRRVFVPVLLAALFVYHIAQTWPHQAVLWLRRPGGRLGLNTDADGPYILLAGISALLVTVATLCYAYHHPFPKPTETYG